MKGKEKTFYNMTGVITSLEVKEAQTKEGPKPYAVARITTPASNGIKSRTIPILTFYPTGIKELQKHKEGDTIRVSGTFESFTGKDGKKKETFAVTGEGGPIKRNPSFYPIVGTVELIDVVEKEGTSIAVVGYYPKGEKNAQMLTASDKEGVDYLRSLRKGSPLSAVATNQSLNQGVKVNEFLARSIEDMDTKPLKCTGIIKDIKFETFQTPLGPKEFASATMLIGKDKEMPLLTLEKSGLEYLKTLKDGDSIEGAVKLEEVEGDKGKNYALKLLGKYINPQNKLIGNAISGKKARQYPDELYIE
jgi:hypothetical protein